MRPALAALAIVLSAQSPLAQEALAPEAGPNLAPPVDLAHGPVRAVSLAWQLYATGLRLEDPQILLTAVRLAHSAGERAATGWSGPADAAGPEPDPGGLPRDPRSDAALALAVIMAEGDPDLADLAADIELDIARGHESAGMLSTATAKVDAKATHDWQMPFFGQSRAELALIGDGTGNLDLRVEDENGHPVCLETGPEDHAYCSFTPAWNGYFTVTVKNPGSGPASYRLMSN